MLTDRAIRAIEPEGRRRKHFDQGGLYLLVTPAGGRLWRLKYRRAGVEKLAALGSYPEISLAEARARQAATKATLAAGGDPLAQRRDHQARAQLGAAATLEAVAQDWHARQAPRWTPGYAANVLANLERLVFPQLGWMHVGDVTPPVLLAFIRQIEARGTYATAHMIRQMLDAIFTYALAAGIAQANPAAQIRGALTPALHRRQPALTSLAGLRTLLERIEATPGYPLIKLALRLLALTACRPSEVREATWQELEHLDGVAPFWRIPPARMKTKAEHIVPLAPQALAVITALRPLSGGTAFLFPSQQMHARPIGHNAFFDVLKRCGFQGQHCAHGFRSSFSTIMNDRHPEMPQIIEAALAHKTPGVAGLYNRADYLERRRELMAEWAGLLFDGAAPPEILLVGPRR